MSSLRSSYGLRRFSLDSGDDLLLPSQSIDLHAAPAAATPSLLPSYSSTMPSRRRAMTSTALMGASGLDMDDPLLGDFNPEEALESSQGLSSPPLSLTEPLFFPSHRASSLSLEPDVFGASHNLGSTVDYPHFRNYHYMPMSHLGYDRSLDLQGEYLDDRFSTPSFHPPRSFSDVELTTLPDSFDLAKPSRLAGGGLDSTRPRLLKRNSIGSVCSTHDDAFAMPPAPSPTLGGQVVKGSFFASAAADSPSSNSSTAPALPVAPVAPVAPSAAATTTAAAAGQTGPAGTAGTAGPVGQAGQTGQTGQTGRGPVEGHHKERGGKKSSAGKMGM